jgi:uncharacterized membrane protein YkoI
MQSALFRLSAAGLVALLVLAGNVSAGEEKVPLDQVPKAVLDAVKAKFPGVKLAEASKEKDETGKIVFELAFTYKDYKYEVELQPDGTFIAIDKQIAFKELPKAVAKTLEDKYPKATYKIIEEVTKKDKVEYYEVELVTADKKAMEVLVDPSGKILKEEKQEDEKKVPADKLPKAVLDAFKAKFPGAKLTGATTEKDDAGKTIFELAFTYKDYKYEAELQPDGTFIAIDKQIDFKELPKAVAKTLEEKYPKATYKIIEEVTKKEKVEYYEVELVTANNMSIEVLIDPSGKILKEEKK